MAEEIDEFDADDQTEQKPDGKKWQAAKRKIAKRCKEADIEFEERDAFTGGKYLIVWMPNGRDKRRVALWDVEDIETILSTPFEKLTYLSDYLAICSYEERIIEAVIRGLGPVGSHLIFRQLFGEGAEDEEEDKIELTLKSDHSEDVTVSIGLISNLIRPFLDSPYQRGSRTLSLKITNINISRHDTATKLLERLANSLFFEIDLSTGIPLNLAKERRRSLGIRRPMRRKLGQLSLEFPKHEYDAAPISLYWYGRSAVGMPLLQYLAFYQVIEFYFPTYSKREAGRKIRALLKNPTFRPDRDSDIGRLLSTIGNSRGGAFGDERTQLRATLQECVDPELLRAFLLEEDARKDFFSKKQGDLTKYKLPVYDKNADLRNDVALLIYDIRCKIVHTKDEEADDDIKLLLPFSKEAELLRYDIELVQYLAEQVLIAASTPFKA